MKVVKLVWCDKTYKYPKEGVPVRGQPVIVVTPEEVDKVGIIYLFSVEEVKSDE